MAKKVVFTRLFIRDSKGLIQTGWEELFDFPMDQLGVSQFYLRGLLDSGVKVKVEYSYAD